MPLDFKNLVKNVAHFYKKLLIYTVFFVVGTVGLSSIELRLKARKNTPFR